MGKVQRKKKSSGVFLAQIFPFFMFFCALYGLIYRSLQIADAFPFHASSIPCQGIVTQLHRTRAGDTSDRYSVSFRYTAAGSVYEGSSAITWQEMQALGEGDVIPVYFSPDNPQNCQAFSPFHFWRHCFLALSMGLVRLFFAIGGMCLVLSNPKKTSSEAFCLNKENSVYGF